VGRSAVFSAMERRATVIAGVLKRQIDEAKTVGANQVGNRRRHRDCGYSAGGGRGGCGRRKYRRKDDRQGQAGGVYASVVEAPQNAAEYPLCKGGESIQFDRKTLEFMAEALRDGS
jgi:hypothetical protein